jgi:serine phosphatase RsbU (regulator of sigma subunit)
VTTAATSLASEAVARLEARPDAVACFDRDWVIVYANGAAARLIGRPVAELIGRNIWVALPELGGTFFHSFLLRARSTGTSVTWAGFYPPAGRWLEATAVVADDLLQVSMRATDRRPHDRHPAAGAPAGRDEGADRLRFLAEVSETMIATLDSGETAARLAELATSRLCDWAFVALRGDDGRFDEDAWAHRDPARRADLDTYLTGRLRAAGDAVLFKALLSGAPVHLATIDEDRVAPTLPTEEVRAAWRRLDTTSCLIVPLRTRGETLGALTLLNAGDRPPHTEMEIATAVEVARRGALALDNARLYDRQLKVAATLQQSLLTAPPRLEGLELAVCYRPAAVYQQVGGDWYDAFPSDGASVLVIGDVVGHDVAASAAMGQMRSMLRTIACDRAESPARTLSRVDRVLATLGDGALATALVARVERPAEPTAPRALRWSSAGHLPPLLRRRDGSVHVLASRPERLLGTDAPGPRTDHEAVLRPGDTLLLYTDGLVEHGHRDLDNGIAQLSAVLRELAAPPLDELCDQVLDRLVTGRTDDDIALLAIRADRAGSEDGVVVGRSRRTAG